MRRPISLLATAFLLGSTASLADGGLDPQTHAQSPAQSPIPGQEKSGSVPLPWKLPSIIVASSVNENFNGTVSINHPVLLWNGKRNVIDPSSDADELCSLAGLGPSVGTSVGQAKVCSHSESFDRKPELNVIRLGSGRRVDELASRTVMNADGPGCKTSGVDIGSSYYEGTYQPWLVADAFKTVTCLKK
jgi:hypothetical protein